MASLPSTYKAFVYAKFGPVDDTLQLQDVPIESLAPTAVRVRVRCAALNPADNQIVEGTLPLHAGSPSTKAPCRLGFDMAGTIVQVGSQAAHKFSVGDDVYAMPPSSGQGTLAEYITVDAECVARKPTSLDFVHAAAVPAVSLTSYQAIVEHGKLQAGETLLVLGGSTSVGMYAIQHAKMIGAKVIATASTQKVDFLKSLGADHVIDYTTTKWSDVLPPHSVDAILECGVEPECWDGIAQTVLKKEASRFVSVFPSASPSPAKFGAVYVAVFAYPSGAQLTEIAKLIDSGKIKPIVDSVFPFDKTLAALSKVKTGRVLGKVVVDMQ